MDWTAVFTILATGMVTLGSVALKGVFDDRARRLELAESRQTSVSDRELELAREERERNEARVRVQQENAEAALTEFAKILGALEAFPDDESARAIEEAWVRGLDSQGRQAAERISDAEARQTIVKMMNALADFHTYTARMTPTRWPGHNAKLLVRSMIELAGTAARRDDRSPSLQNRVDKFEERWAQYRAQADATEALLTQLRTLPQPPQT